MGGHSIGLGVRLYKEKYLSLKNRVLTSLSDLELISIPELKDKEDFGDLDLLISKHKCQNLKDIILERFNSNLITSSSNVYSFEVEGFQVDLISTLPENMNFSKFFYSYSFLGPTIGKISKVLRIKTGSVNAKWILKIDQKSGEKLEIDEYFLTNDPEKYCNFMGLDYNYLINNHLTKNDLCEFLYQCKYLSTSQFSNSLEDPRLGLFSNYILKKPIKEYNRPDMNNIIENVEEFFNIDLKNKINNRIEKYEKNIKIKEKFNGNIVMNLTPLVGKDLGIFLNYFKNSLKNYEDTILILSSEEIEKLVIDYYQKWK